MNRSIRCLILLLCVVHGSHAKADEQHAPHESHAPQNAATPDFPYDAELVATLGADSQSHGDAARGAALFSNVKLACLSCHKIGLHGGSVGPDLTAIAKDRSLSHLIESVLWPRRDVKPEYLTWSILTASGGVVTGYNVRRDGPRHRAQGSRIGQR